MQAHIRAVPSRFRHVVHAYAAVPAWSRDDRRILYLGFDDTDHGQIVVQNLESREERVLAQTTGFDFHTAAGQRWIMHDSAVIYRVGSEGEPKTMMVPADGSSKPLPLDLAPRLLIRHVCDDTMRGIGSAWLKGTPQSIAIVMVRFQGMTIETIMHLEEAIIALPRELMLPDVQGYSIDHPVANASADRIFFKLMRHRQNGNREFCAMFVKDLETGTLLCLGNRISGHPVWMPDGQHILNIKSPRDGSDNRWLVLQDSSTGEDRRVIDLPIEGPGHPTVSPDGRFIATDAFVPDGSVSPIYLIDTQTQAAREIARLPHRFQPSSVYDPERLTRGQPHPVWSHGADQLLVNCNNNGTASQLLILSNFLSTSG